MLDYPKNQKDICKKFQYIIHISALIKKKKIPMCSFHHYFIIYCFIKEKTIHDTRKELFLEIKECVNF